jgi:hypothetical protein
VASFGGRAGKGLLLVLGGIASLIVSAVVWLFLAVIAGAAWGAAPAILTLGGAVFLAWLYWGDRTPMTVITLCIPAITAIPFFLLGMHYVISRLSECSWGSAYTITTQEQAIDHALRVAAQRRETLEASGFANADEFAARLKERNCCEAALKYDAQLLRRQWTVWVKSRGWETMLVFNRCGLHVDEGRTPD